MPVLLDRRVRQRVEDERVARVRKALDLFPRRPFGPPAAAGIGLVLGIDPAREQALERVVDAGRPSAFFTSALTLNAGRWPS